MSLRHATLVGVLALTTLSCRSEPGSSAVTTPTPGVATSPTPVATRSPLEFDGPLIVHGPPWTCVQRPGTSDCAKQEALSIGLVEISDGCAFIVTEGGTRVAVIFHHGTTWDPAT